MKRIRVLNSVIQAYNGILARYKKNPDEDNQKLLDDCLLEIKTEVDKILL